MFEEIRDCSRTIEFAILTSIFIAARLIEAHLSSTPELIPFNQLEIEDSVVVVLCFVLTHYRSEFL